MSRFICVVSVVGFFLIPSIICQSNLLAQENLEGKWISSSIVFNKRETKIEDKKSKEVIHFKKNKRYSKQYYKIKHSSDSGVFTLSFNFREGKTRVNGAILKKKKTLEKGFYQISETEIIFNSPNEKDTVTYQLRKEVLTLGYHLYSGSEKMNYEIKFNRVR